MDYKRLNIPLLLLLFLVLALNPNYAQISLGGKPKSALLNKELSIPPIKKMPTINLEALLEEDEFNDELVDYPTRFAHSIPVDINLDNAGKWTTLDNGDRIWRITIESNDALSLNFLYSDFFLPKGSLFYIYNEEKTQTIGGFSTHNNKPHRKFATGIVKGDKITLEYFEPQAVEGEGSIAISHVNHAYRDVSQRVRPLGDSNTCQVDVNCSEGSAWQDEKKGVVRTLLDGTSWCSGSLVRVLDNENCTSYVLAANHCLNGLYDAITAPVIANYIFYFNYENSICNTTGTPPTETITGATLVANDPSLDFSLLKLDTDPVDSGYDVYLNGWDARDQTPAADGVCIHHPQGDAKKIATYSGVPVSLGNRWQVSMEATTNGHSIMEIGSSGSPLFDNNGRILGQLYGADVSFNCSSSGTQSTFFPKLSLSWDNNGIIDNRRKLQPWLDPNEQTPLFIDGVYANTVTCSTVLAEISTFDATTEAEGTDCTNRTISFDITLTAAPSDDVNVNWAFSGTASNPDDYTFSGGTTHTFTTANWSTPKTVTITVIQDAVKEDNENIVVDISSATGGGATVGSNSQLVFTLSDDDPSPEETVLFSEDFEGSINWNQATLPGSTNTWTLGTTPTLSNNSAYISSGSGYTYNNTTSIARLQSPTFSTVGYTKLNLSFDYICEGESSLDFGSLNYSIDGGANWVVFGTNLEGQGTATSFSIDLPAAAENVSQLRLGFRWDNNDSVQNQPPFAVDNIVLTGVLESSTYIQTTVNSLSGFAEHYLGPFQTVHFHDQTTGKIMLTIEELSGFDYGCTRVEVDRAGVDDTAWILGNQVTNKTFRVTPTTNHSTGQYNITLYYENTELPTFFPNISSMVKGEDSINNATNNNTNSYAVTYTQAAFGNHFKFTSQFGSGFSGFGLSDALPGPLPVELVYFKAIPEIRTIRLDWLTASEIDNKGFELQRSTNPAEGFRNIAWIDGNGTISTKQSYNFDDSDVFEGIDYYYRLKQIDFDGNYEFSNIVSAKIEARSKQIKLIPNPARDIVTIQLNKELKEGSEINLFSINGILIKRLEYSNISSSSINIDVRIIAKGMYLLNIKNQDIDITEKLIIE